MFYLLSIITPPTSIAISWVSSQITVITVLTSKVKKTPFYNNQVVVSSLTEDLFFSVLLSNLQVNIVPSEKRAQNREA